MEVIKLNIQKKRKGWLKDFIKQLLRKEDKERDRI